MKETSDSSLHHLEWNSPADANWESSRWFRIQQEECLCRQTLARHWSLFAFFYPGLSLPPPCWLNKWVTGEVKGQLINHFIIASFRKSVSLAARLFLLLPVVTLLQFPVHDLTNHRGGEQAEQLQDAKDGRVQADWERSEKKDGLDEVLLRLIMSLTDESNNGGKVHCFLFNLVNS